MRNRARTRTLAGLVAAVALAGALVQPVAATYPGSLNGRIVFGADVGGTSTSIRRCRTARRAYG